MSPSELATDFDRDLEYLARVHPPLPPLLAEIERRGNADGVPIVSRDTGRLLSTLTSCMLATNILEIGTGYGYSTLWMALAQPEAGRIVTIEADPSHAAIARGFFQKAGKGDRIDVIESEALRALPQVPKRLYDILLLDAVKEEYERYLALTLPLLKRSGLVIVDNLLWHHQASAQPTDSDAAATVAIRRFNEAFLSHPALNATIVPVGDGVGIGAKI